MTQKAVAYCRISSKSQEVNGHGLESQESRCRAFAQANDLDIVAVFPDTMTGGGSFMKRPGMVALLSFLDAQPDEKFTIIFDDLKRASRDTRAFLDLRDAFRKRNARVECLNFKFDETPEGEFIETIIAAQGALERKQNGRQVAQKMEARMKSGYWIHTCPIGFKYITVKGRGKMLVPNPPFDGIIREAFEGFSSGRFGSQAEVKRFFESFAEFPRNKRGDVTGQRVTDILTHPVYTGHICSTRYDINWLKAQHEGLISLEVFDKVQARRKNVTTAPRRANIGAEFALRGMVSCAGCGVPLRSSVTKGNGGHYHYYLCQTKACDHYGKSIKRDQIEGEVGVLIKSLQPTKGLMTLVAAMFRRAWDMRSEQAKEMHRAADRKIKECDKQIDSLLTRILDATNARVIAAYENKIDELDSQKARHIENREKQVEPAGSFEEKLEPALTFLSNPFKLWESGHIAVRQIVLKLCLSDRLEYCRNTGPRTPALAFPFKALGGNTVPRVCYGAGEGTRTPTP